MKKIYFFFTTLFVLFAFAAISDSAQHWSKIFRREGGDIVKFILQTADGGYILKANTESFQGSETWLVKLDSSGLVQWQKTYASAIGSEHESNTLQQTSNGGYIVTGSDSGGFALLRLDTAGEITWQKNYDWGVIDHAKSVQQTSDGGYIVAGATYENWDSTTKYDLWVLKLDSGGNIEWQKTYGGGNNDLASAIQQPADGGYIVAGYTWSFGAGNYDYWVLKLDGGGNISWQKTYGDENINYAESVQQTVDGGYIVAGYTSDALRHAWVLKLDSSGIIEWQKSYNLPGFNEVHSIQQATDGGYVMAGGGAGELWVVKLDSNGVISWEKTYGDSGTDVAFSVQETADGGYITGGYTLSFGSLSYDAWVLKLDSEGEINNCEIVGLNPAIVTDTTISGVDSSASVTITDAVVTDTTIIPQSVTADIITNCEDQPPYTSDHQPFDTQTNVPIDTDIEIHVRDSDSGVDQGTIAMTVEGLIVFDGAVPGSYPDTAISGDASDYTLTYNPAVYFGYEQVVNVEVTASDIAGNAMVPDVYSFMIEPEITTTWDNNDTDGDGISNSAETDILHTDPSKRTLFVRARVFSLSSEYWTDQLMALFPPSSGSANGKAYIDAFSEADIEVVVVGAPDNPYEPMQDPGYDPALDTTDFDPDTDGVQPVTLHIMTLWRYDTYKAGSPLEGHTEFKAAFTLPSGQVISTWRWDTKGLTPVGGAADYWGPRVYTWPLDFYMAEGAYPQIGIDALPVGLDCSAVSCNQCSPMNLKDDDTGPPYEEEPDGTVEFNTITFDDSGAITFVGAMGEHYSRDDVLRRTLIHEMGHGLHFDHCENPGCIMYHHVTNWELYNGGTQTRYGYGTMGPEGETCTHNVNIRAIGTIHNASTP